MSKSVRNLENSTCTVNDQGYQRYACFVHNKTICVQFLFVGVTDLPIHDSSEDHWLRDEDQQNRGRKGPRRKHSKWAHH
ncbi:hypothetical protein UC8_24760 [Roseimaritima ulvae]|uniref:Uncharacterized protein n=1 Tax=Roseimaritima ulvae TaxID=980254 RepID=A0A5B9QNB9_9BACT|nr:hypothetical protein UC8_24760 [Roseimaritima ulvae]